jgi:hypothetical protein
MTLEQIRKRGAEVSNRLAALAAIVQREGRTLSDAEIQENNSLEAEFETLQEDERVAALQLPTIPRGNAMARGIPEAAFNGNLLPVGQRRASINAPTVLTRTTIAQRNGDKFEGQSWARLQLAKLRTAVNFSEGIAETPAEICAHVYRDRPELARIASARRLAAGVEGGGVLSGEAGSELRNLDAQYTGDFIEFLYSHTLFDQLGFRDVPADVRIKGIDGAYTGYWVGEKRSIPVSQGSYSAVDLNVLKAAGLTYLSKDLIRRSAPAAEMLFRDGVVQAVSQAVDTKAFSTDAASANVSPAGLFQGLTGQASAGGSIQNLYQDLAYLTSIFVAAKQSTKTVKLLSNRVVANQIAHLMSPLTGLPAFLGQLDENGGNLDGKVFLTGDNLPANNLVAIKVDDIWKIGDSGVQVSLSTDATIEADSAPTGEGVTPTAQSASMVSMFQTDSVAIKCVRDINYAYRRAQAIVTARITGADYNGVASTD